MTFILLISRETSFLDQLQVALPANVRLLRATTISQAQPHLTHNSGDQPLIALILFHAEKRTNLVAGCSGLRQDMLTANIPLVALLDHPENRQPALEAGADDYLLLPLVPAEVKARVGNYCRFPIRIFSGLAPLINRLKGGAMPPYIWEEGLANLAEIFTASSAWVFLADTAGDGITLAGAYNLPSYLEQAGNELRQEIAIFFKNLRRPEADPTEDIVGAYPIWAVHQNEEEFCYHLNLPLHSGRKLFGLLTLAFPHSPSLSHLEKQTLAVLGHTLGILLEMCHIQEEIQIHATQNAFIVLLARTITERLDLNTILALTLEQAIPLLNASGGDIWLLSANGEWLDLASSVTSPFNHPTMTRRASGQGLIGWVVKHGKTLHTADPLNDPRSDLEVDLPSDTAIQSLLALPLQHRGKIIGVLAVHKKQPLPFAHVDTILLEGIASLTASAIVQTQLMQNLRLYANQGRVLYEMSHQIAAGLDLQATLNRTLYWAARLLDVEIGTLWLIEQDTGTLDMVAVLGSDSPAEESCVLAIGEGLVGWVAAHGEGAVVNDPANDSRFNANHLETFGMLPRNIIALPMTYHSEIIGVLSLFNKKAGSFNEADLTLLSTAIEMIAVAVGNARLYTQTVTLMEEHERLHQQILQAERLSTIGRLTASLSHEINNPMQAIQGALMLAMEELNSPENLSAYLQLCLAESKRVVQLLNRMRQVYRPQADVMESLDLNQLLQEAIALARKELKWQNISLHTDLAPDLPHLTAVANQLHLVFLSLLLNLGDAISNAGGGELYLHSYVLSYALSQTVRIDFSTDIIITPVTSLMNSLDPSPSAKEADFNFGLSLSQDIIAAHGGTIEFSAPQEQTVCSIVLPAGKR